MAVGPCASGGPTALAPAPFCRLVIFLARTGAAAWLAGVTLGQLGFRARSVVAVVGRGASPPLMPAMDEAEAAALRHSAALLHEAIRAGLRQPMGKAHQT